MIFIRIILLLIIFCIPANAIFFSGAFPTTTTWSGSDKAASISLSAGNLTANISSDGALQSGRSIASRTSGLIYFEDIYQGNGSSGGVIVGAVNATPALVSTPYFLGQDNDSVGAYFTGDILRNGIVVGSFSSSTLATNDVVGTALNINTKLIWFRKNNGGWNNDIIANQNPALGLGGIDVSAITGAIFAGYTLQNTTDQVTANFGATSYAQTPPLGFGNL